MNKNKKAKTDITTKKGKHEVSFKSGHDLWMKLRSIKNTTPSFML